MFQNIASQIDRFTAASGVNVVGIDDYELPGDDQHLIGNYPDLASAKKAAAAHTKSTGEKTLLYDTSGIVKGQ